MCEEQQQEKGTGKRIRKVLAALGVLCVCALLGIGAVIVIRSLPPEGCPDYTVQMEQHYVEYSEEYEYGDVLTVEYPRLQDADTELQDKINATLYDTAMDRVNYWHLSPDEEVQDFQENFAIFCSDVTVDVPFHSQYLLSADYHELYSAGNPVWYTMITERAVNVDLLTGEVYELGDIITIDEEFTKLWCDAAQDKYGEPFEGDREEYELFLSWFQDEDEEMKEFYRFSNFFYPTQDGTFMIGLAYDPRPAAIRAVEPRDVTYSVELDAELLTPFRTESKFWQQYERSEQTGQVLECEDLQTNLWLRDDASVWSYWEERGQ